MAADDAGDDVGDVGQGIDVVELGGLGERGEDAQCSAPPSEPADRAFFRQGP